MEKGLNTDVNVSGYAFHIQTEDWGIQNPYLVTRIYKNGAVLKTIKNHYQHVIESNSQDFSEALRLAMKEQHFEILDLIYSGQL